MYKKFFAPPCTGVSSVSLKVCSLQVLVGVAPDLLGEDQVALAGGVIHTPLVHELVLHPGQVH